MALSVNFTSMLFRADYKVLYDKRLFFCVSLKAEDLLYERADNWLVFYKFWSNKGKKIK